KIHTDKGEDSTLGISIKKDASLAPALPATEVDTPGGRIRHARLSKHMCLVDLAKATGLSVVSLRLAEQNRTSLTPTNLRIIASVLGVSVAYLGCFESLSEDTLGQRIEKQGYIMVIHRVSSQDFWV
ncbi:helix-turn-helix transcriptional regulator, partial [Brevibacillus agri]|nr:helix-turn-helix transcriptional regulator [Brevibacillus agri]